MDDIEHVARGKDGWMVTVGSTLKHFCCYGLCLCVSMCVCVCVRWTLNKGSGPTSRYRLPRGNGEV